MTMAAIPNRMVDAGSARALTVAMILFAHGARDARWAAPFVRLQQIIQQRQPELAVHLAFLEFMTPNLPDLVALLVADGVQQVQLVPVFLGQGGHVLRDLPQLLAQLQRQYPQLHLHCLPAVGENDAVLQAIADYCLSAPPAL